MVLSTRVLSIHQEVLLLYTETGKGLSVSNRGGCVLLVFAPSAHSTAIPQHATQKLRPYARVSSCNSLRAVPAHHKAHHPPNYAMPAVETLSRNWVRRMNQSAHCDKTSMLYERIKEYCIISGVNVIYSFIIIRVTMIHSLVHQSVINKTLAAPYQ